VGLVGAQWPTAANNPLPHRVYRICRRPDSGVRSIAVTLGLLKRGLAKAPSRRSLAAGAFHQWSTDRRIDCERASRRGPSDETRLSSNPTIPVVRSEQRDSSRFPTGGIGRKRRFQIDNECNRDEAAF
jgi:hypothetical protein